MAGEYNDISTELVKQVSELLPNKSYRGNLDATKQLMALLHEKSETPLSTADDYIRFYEDSCLTFTSWEELVESEKEETVGLSEEELLNLIGSIVYELPCGWFVWFF